EGPGSIGLLAALGACWDLIEMVQRLMPRDAPLGSRPLYDILGDTAVWLAPTGGLALAAMLNLSAPKPPRLRVMIGLTLFGVIHLLAQRKGWFYHVYPLVIGLNCWCVYSLDSLSMRRSY